MRLRYTHIYIIKDVQDILKMKGKLQNNMYSVTHK